MRLYHSPSSIALGRRCQRAWAYCYLEGMRDPEVPWAESWADALPEGVTPRMRSTALGKTMHGTGEGWYRHEPVDWSTYPATVFLSGIHLLPHADRVDRVHVEQAIGESPMPAGASEHAPPTRMQVADGGADGGVWFAGYKDLLVNAPAELARLGIASASGWLLIDYKSTANVARYSLSSEALADDVQCNLYALDACTRLGLESIPARWVYFETKRKRIAAPVDVLVTKRRALEVLQPVAAFARELDALERVTDAPCNTDACDEMGGCQYHKSRGGPCPATRTSLGKSIAQSSKGTTITMSPEMQAKLDALKNGGGAPAPAPADTTTDAPASEGPAPSDTPPAAPPPKRGRPAAAKAPAPGGTLGATMHALADELTSAEALVADVRRRMGEALA